MAIYRGALLPGQRLLPGDEVRSNNRAFNARYQEDGQFALYRRWDGVDIWSSDTAGHVPGQIEVQHDGNTVMTDADGSTPWDTAHGARAPHGHALVPGSSLVLQDDGQLLVITPDNVPIWESRTVQTDVPEMPPDPEPQPGPGPLPEPGVHSDPVRGRLRVLGDGDSFGDDSGARVFCIAHMGDLAARWYAADGHQRAEILKDVDDAAAAGYHILRPWWHLRADNWPWNQGGSPRYNGLDALRTHRFVEDGAELIREVAKRGMRTAVGPGGLDGIGTSQEEELFRRLRQIVDLAGHENVAWIEGVNEPSSTHATTDNDGDNQPGHLTRLVRIAQEGTGILWHLGYWDNNNYEDSGRYCVPGMSYNYVHGWRGGNVFNKIDRRFTWCRVFKNEGVGGERRGRLTIDGESVGWPVTGPPLQNVSATQNGHEMNSAEALALIACATAVRGIPSHMSGTGVQRFEPFTNTVGWRHIPWTCRQLPEDVATFDLFHGGQSDARLVMKATTNSHGVLARADQAIHSDGRFVAILYNQVANQRQAFPFLRRSRFVALDPEQMTATEHAVDGGGRFDIDMFWGRVLVGQVE